MKLKKKLFKEDIILFENGEQKTCPEEFSPQPASKFLPDWYKNLSSYNGSKLNENGGPNSTAKKCVPLFDAISSGYILTTFCDIDVSNNDGTHYFRWRIKDENLIDSHPHWQTGDHPKKQINAGMYKYNNAWSIKTPPGYSCIIVPPMHRDNPLVILPGIVDTDKYTDIINFPFYVKDGFSGIVPAGTPIAQIIPYKREPWQAKRGGRDLLLEKGETFKLVTSKFTGAYKKFLWSRKEYR